MAFVIRSNRVMTFTNNDSGIGPGQYFDENNTDNYSNNISIDRINNSTYNSILSKKKNLHYEVPFNTTSLRAPIYNTDDVPGPGAYGPSTTETFNINNNIENLKTVSSYYTNNLTSNSENKGFLTSSKRFDFDKFKFNNNNNNEFSTPVTYYNDNIYNNTISSNNNNNNFFDKKKLKKINYKSLSNERVCSIPAKENFGYNINKNGDVIMAKDPDENIKLSGLKENSAGPGQYNLNLSWNKGQIKYKPEKKINKQKEIINELQNNNNNISETTLTTYTEKMKINQSSLNNSNIKIEDEKKNNNNKNNNNNNNNPRNKIFHDFLERKNKNHKKNIELNDKNIISITQKKYIDSPGPGFYEKDYREINKNQFKHSSNLQNFGSSSPKKSEFLNANINNTVGPGEYFKEKNKYEKNNNNNNIFYNINNNNNKYINNFNNIDPKDVGVLMSNLRKNNVNKILGPGQYNISRNFIKKNFSNLHQFNSTNPRFKEKKIEPKIQYKKEENNKKYLIQATNPKVIIKNETEEEKFISYVKKNINKDNNKNSIPAVGTYNPGIAYSIEYQNSKKMNPHQSFIAPFNTINNRFGYTKNEIIGPGNYNYDVAFNKLKATNRQFKIFGEDEERFKNSFGEKMLKNNPGPGNYNISNSFDWNKKTFNVLFKSK